eukprot:scaffold1188_cov33-Tisochrysis_lutea.AAC.3
MEKIYVALAQPIERQVRSPSGVADHEKRASAANRWMPRCTAVSLPSSKGSAPASVSSRCISSRAVYIVVSSDTADGPPPVLVVSARRVSMEASFASAADVLPLNQTSHCACHELSREAAAAWIAHTGTEHSSGGHATAPSRWTIFTSAIPGSSAGCLPLARIPSRGAHWGAFSGRSRGSVATINPRGN